MKLSYAIFVLAAVCSSARAQIPAPVTNTIGTPGPAGSPVVIQTTTIPLTTVGGVSLGAYGSTTTVGGSSVNGSGGIIPNGSPGSTQTSVGGLSVTYPPPPPPNP